MIKSPLTKVEYAAILGNMRFEDALNYAKTKLDEHARMGVAFNEVSYNARIHELGKVLNDFPEEILAALEIAVAHERIVSLIKEGHYG